MKWIAPSIAAGALALGALPALAGGPVMTPAPAPAPMAAPAPAPMNGNWTGFSAGLDLGYADTNFAGANGSGVTYGVRGAYDYDFGNWVMGVTGSYDASDFTVGADKMKSIARIGLRAGIDAGNGYLYATGGGAQAAMTIGGANVTGDGWFAGLGAEYRLAGNWTLGGEILTNEFKNYNSSGSALRATTLTMNVSYRF